MVTFLFTDIEGSTRRWASDAAGIRLELIAHDWRSVKHAGDGVIDHLRQLLGGPTYEPPARTGATVTYGFDQIDQARTELELP